MTFAMRSTGMSSDAVVVTDYDAAWPAMYKTFADRVAAAFADAPPITLHIEHVGSTSVPGLPAKPIIDLDVVVALADVPRALKRLSALGYVHGGDGGLPGREALRWPPGEARHHLYVCTSQTPAYRDHLLFRDILRSHPEVAAEYAALKRELAVAHADDRPAYQAAKGAFVDKIMRHATSGTFRPTVP